MRPDRRLVAGYILEEGRDGSNGDVGFAVFARGRRGNNVVPRTGSVARRTTMGGTTIHSTVGITMMLALLGLDGLARDTAKAQNFNGHVHHFELKKNIYNEW